MKTITVVGDYIEDKYTFGNAYRICPEAPVPVIIPRQEKSTPGGAGLVNAQLVELGADVFAEYGSHSEKHRIFADKHLICRVDSDSYMLSQIKANECNGDVIVVSDYGKGAMTEGLAKKLVASGKPLFVDAKHHWDWYKGEHSVAFPNEHEQVDSRQWHMVAQKLGPRGAMLCGEELTKIEATTDEVVDVTGAGDIFMAGFVWAWLLEFLPVDCLRFANILAGESCRHLGTYVVPRAFAKEVFDMLRPSPMSPPQVPDYSLDSKKPVPPPRPPKDRKPTSIDWQDGGGYDIPLGGCDPEPAIRAVSLDNPHYAQIPPKVPLDPTVRLGVPAPLDQKIVGGIDKKWR